MGKMLKTKHISIIRINCYAVLLIVLTFPFSVFSQSIAYINGKVINSENSQPVPFATVYLQVNKIGVFANADGDFKILRDKRFETDSVIVTCIGFHRSTISYNNLEKSDINKIFLTPNTYTLSEVKIIESKRTLRPVQIVKKAIENIGINYPVKPFTYISYYRDYQKKDETYINLNEAIIQTWDTGFFSNDILDRYALLDFRKNSEFLRKDFSHSFNRKGKYIPIANLPDRGGNELQVLMAHDALRNYKSMSFSFFDTFSKDFIANHNFLEITPVFDNNVLLYKINFSAVPKITGDTLKFIGDIFIQAKNYAIHRIDYSGSYKPQGKEWKEMFNVKIEYGFDTNLDTVLHLKYISFNNLFNFYDTAVYFKISRIHRDSTHNSSVIVDFNNKIDFESASKVESYSLKIGNKKAKIKDISVGDMNVVINLKQGQDLKGNYAVNIENMKDIYGNILNEGKDVEYHQYRELFVQEYNKPAILKDSCYMENKPLERNCLAGYQGEKTFWMNTPIKEQKQDSLK
jgi:hypothetical protein